MTSEIEVAARRAATRRNNKTRREIPLLADFFQTSPEAEMVRIERQRASAEVYLARLRESSELAWQKGLILRDIARGILPPEKWSTTERMWEKWKGECTPTQNGHDLVSWWWESLKGTEWAFEHCPNRDRHNDPDWWKPHFHFLHKQWVETTECPTCGKRREKTA